MQKKIAILLILFILSLGYVYLQYFNGSKSVPSTQSKSGSLVPSDQIVSGGPPPDGIPSIDHPDFVSASNATFLSNSSVVIGININGQAKAYPLLILVWHEIVNDNVSGLPIAITYCPLCYSSAAYIRQINGTTVQFGTSGKLYNNNLVMYDRLTKSLWSEIWGKAIAGNLTGYTLQRVPADVMPWNSWKQLYPNTLVLSENTGFSRPYGTDPYGNYYSTPGIYFPLNHDDSRLPQKTIIMGLQLNGDYRAYQINTFNRSMVISDSIVRQKVAIFVNSLGNARIFNPYVNGEELHFSFINGNFVDTDTNSAWNFEGNAVSGTMKGKSLQRFPTTTAFWFAWAAFYPNTSIYGYS